MKKILLQVFPKQLLFLIWKKCNPLSPLLDHKFFVDHTVQIFIGKICGSCYVIEDVQQYTRRVVRPISIASVHHRYEVEIASSNKS